MDIMKLYRQGRAKTPYELWSPEENELVHRIANERHVGREAAADYVRNGVKSLDEFDALLKKDFKPKKFEEMVNDGVLGAEETVKKVVKSRKGTKKGHD